MVFYIVVAIVGVFLSYMLNVCIFLLYNLVCIYSDCQSFSQWHNGDKFGTQPLF